MKKIFIFFIAGFFLITNSLFADEDKIKMRPQDRLIFDIFIDLWQDVPDDMDLIILNRGINVALFQDFPLGYSNFGIATGLSFTTHNMYSDHWYKYCRDIDGFDFEKIDEDYNNNKISINYIDIPLEFRYRTRPSKEIPHTFRIAIGAKFGYMIQAHTKYRGDYSYNNEYTREVKFKEHNLGNIENWRYGILARIGYSFINITAYYPLTGIFKDNTAADMRPVSLGVSFTIN